MPGDEVSLGKQNFGPPANGEPCHRGTLLLMILTKAWRVLHKAEQNHELANTGLYAHVRHPQYVAFVVVMFGFLVQWPTLLTLIMFPVLVWVYARLARYEEREAVAAFGEHYLQYAATTPAFIPRFGHVNKIKRTMTE